MNRKVIALMVCMAMFGFGLVGHAIGQDYEQRTPMMDIGVSAEEMETIAKGWSVRQNFLGEQVYNDENEVIGVVEDVIVVFDKEDDNYGDNETEKRDKLKKLQKLDKAKLYAIIGTGGFLGIAMHNVAIPMKQLKMVDERITLPGATAEALRQLPAFEHPDE